MLIRGSFSHGKWVIWKKKKAQCKWFKDPFHLVANLSWFFCSRMFFLTVVSFLISLRWHIWFQVVNDICLLSSGGRIASCDGTIHVWNSQTGKLISAYAEPPTNSSHLTSSLSTVSKVNTEQTNMLNSNTLSGGILSSDGSLYTCMHHLESDDKLVVGMGNGSLRYISYHNMLHYLLLILCGISFSLRVFVDWHVLFL